MALPSPLSAVGLIVMSDGSTFRTLCDSISTPLRKPSPHPYTFSLWLTMDVRSGSTPESGRCEACNRFFFGEASLTKHLRNHCPAAYERSRRLWKNGASNIKKLNTSLTHSRKRVRDEVREDYSVRDEQPVYTPHDIESVRILLVVYSQSG
jgi:hypothetical protein